MIPISNKEFEILKEKGIYYVDTSGYECLIIQGIIFFKLWSNEDVREAEKI
jgi:hypothetical protein